MPDIFISYSRRDQEFVKRLFDSLTGVGLDVWVDWEDIEPTADWWQRINQGIETSNTVLFVVSPESLASPVCMMEANYALGFNKRFIPLLREETEVEDAIKLLAKRQAPVHLRGYLENKTLTEIAYDNWQFIGRYNWIYFDSDDKYANGFERLLASLRQDIEHVDEHTLWLNRAIQWETRKRRSGYLLSAMELREMGIWLELAKNKDPLPTDLHYEYFKESRNALRANFIKSSTTVTMVASLAIVIALLAVYFNRDRLFAEPLEPMNKFFNIAVAEFVLDDGETQLVTDDSQQLADMIRDRVTQYIRDNELEDELDYRHDGLPAIVGANRLSREEVAALLAQEMNADIVLYGMIDAQRQEFIPYIYIDPALTGAEELIGESVFAAPFDVPLPLASDPVNRKSFQNEMDARTDAIIAFMRGIIATKAGSYDEATQHYLTAVDVPVWDKGGLEVVYLWMGSNYTLDAYSEVMCPFRDDAETFSVVCAAEAYQAAIDENDVFSRAYIGMGNALYLQAFPDFPNVEDDPPACHMIAQADGSYQQALALEGIDPTFEDAMIDLKTYANMARVYRDAMQSNCGRISEEQRQAYYDRAVEAFAAGIESANYYTETTDNDYLIARERANLEYGWALTERRMGNFERAIDHLDLSIAASQPEGYQQRWQELQYAAQVQKGHVYLEQGIRGDAGFYEQAVPEYEAVIEAYEANRFNSEAVLGDATYWLGYIYEQQGDCDTAREYYNTVRGIRGASERVKQLAAERCLT